MPAVTSLDGQRISTGKVLDMNDLGIDAQDEDGDPDYDMGDEVFYDEEIRNAVTMKVTNVQIGASVKKEQTEYDRFIKAYEATLDRKTNIWQL